MISSTVESERLGLVCQCLAQPDSAAAEATKLRVTVRAAGLPVVLSADDSSADDSALASESDSESAASTTQLVVTTSIFALVL